MDARLRGAGEQPATAEEIATMLEPSLKPLLCALCDTPSGLNTGEGEVWFCSSCRTKYPASLLKANCDPFDYALLLRGGMLIRFQSADITGDYVTLHNDEHYISPGYYEDKFTMLAFPCPRGVDVRVADILWCADAPEGS